MDGERPVELREPAPSGKGLGELSGIALTVEQYLRFEPDGNFDRLETEGHIGPEGREAIRLLRAGEDAPVHERAIESLGVIVDIRTPVAEHPHPLPPPASGEMPEHVLLRV